MATAIASTTACVRYRLTRKCLPLNVAIDLNQPAGATGSPENGGHRNKRPARASTGEIQGSAVRTQVHPLVLNSAQVLGGRAFLWPRGRKFARPQPTAPSKRKLT